MRARRRGWVKGGVIAAGVDPELDRLRALERDGLQTLAEIQRREIEATGIPSLKVGHHAVFGYYLEVTHTHRDKVPAHYVRKQTLKNAERYITPELKEYEHQVATARERAAALEQQLFVALREAAEAHAPQLRRLARAVAILDVLVGFARLARERNYCRPEVGDDLRLEIEQGRHPVLEQTLTDTPFVPNDVALGGEGQPRLAVITGSQHGRQVHLLPAGGAHRAPGTGGQLRAGPAGRRSGSPTGSSAGSDRPTRS
ncbi:MAG: hypothetical protein KatS3mg102_1044 [Planctomycetota bacterium]|nr:MAG: hypothetical protein KatS3mg102_1044 [Planctomycetota bacterium]